MAGSRQQGRTDAPPHRWSVLVSAIWVAACTSGPAPQPEPPADPKPAITPAAGGSETLLFDGRQLGHWAASEFGGEGAVRIDNDNLILEMGNDLTGVHWRGPLVKMNYEITLEAMRVQGHDFFCGLTFPVGDDPCTLIVGGWGGALVGLSSLNGYDASENDTTTALRLENDRWYRIRLRVTEERIQAFIDDTRLINIATGDYEYSIRYEVEPSQPLGFASWRTTAALRHIKLKKL